MWKESIAGIAFTIGSLALARFCDAFFDVDDKEPTFPLAALPRELRLMVLERILANDPPTISQYGKMRHAFLDDKFIPIYKDAPGTLLFHTVPLVVDHDFLPADCPSVCPFLERHDDMFGTARRHRIKLEITPRESFHRCMHFLCCIRYFRCHSWVRGKQETLAEWRRFRKCNGIPLENLSVKTVDESLVDFKEMREHVILAILRCASTACLIVAACIIVTWEAFRECIKRIEDRFNNQRKRGQQYHQLHHLQGSAWPLMHLDHLLSLIILLIGVMIVLGC